MFIQKSFQNEERGKLYIVPTPIGNLEDMTFRAINTLKQVDLIAAEDTRQTKKLLNHFEISTPIISYHEHNKQTQGENLKEQLIEGKKIALVSDAGMPVISDPGYDLVKLIGDEADVIVLPGANAALCAFVGSGLANEQFYFYGFLPRKKKELHQALEKLKYIEATLIFYESPHRITDTVSGIAEILGRNRNIVLARELTKKFEEYVKGTAGEVEDWLNSDEAEKRGEFCIVVEGTDEIPKVNMWWEDMSIIEHVNYYIDEKNMTSKQAVKQTAEDRELPKREVYNTYHT